MLKVVSQQAEQQWFNNAEVPYKGTHGLVIKVETLFTHIGQSWQKADQHRGVIFNPLNGQTKWIGEPQPSIELALKDAKQHRKDFPWYDNITGEEIETLSP